MTRAGLPPALVGIDAPIIVRDADFFGRTVNIAARLADYARPREVLVSAEVARAWGGEDTRFREIGPVSLKGVPEPVVVYAADA